MNTIDPAQAIDAASKALGAIVSLVGLVVAISQWTRPAILRRRAKWLQETIGHEQNDLRLATLGSMLHGANVALVAGTLVPGWRFLSLTAIMLLGPIQVFMWARNDAGVWHLLGALVFSLILVMIPIRMGVRLLIERYRVAYEYREAINPMRPARLGILDLMEGGSRSEIGFGVVAAIGVNGVALGTALALLDEFGWGLTFGIAGAGIIGVIAVVIIRHARKRVSIYGPWPVADART